MDWGNSHRHGRPVPAIAVIGPARPLAQPVLRALRAHGADAVAVAVANGAAAVVHVAGADADTWLRDPEEGARVVVDRTRRVLRDAERGGVTALVHVSSASVYGAWADNPVPLSEDSPLRPNPAFPYARAHAEAERLVQEWRDQHPDVSVAVLRPAIVMGGDGPSWMARAVGALQAPLPRDEGRPLQFVHADDVAAAVALAVERQLTGTYNVAPDGWVPDEKARALAGGIARLPLPAWLARPLARVGWRITRRGVPAGATPWTTHPWVVANDRLRAEGWEPAYTNEEAFVAAAPPAKLSSIWARRRQELTLGAAGTVIAGAAAGVIAVIRSRRRT